MATFPSLIRFLGDFAAKKPESAKRFLKSGKKNIIGFLPALLGGLRRSQKPEIYSELIEEYIKNGEHLFPIARYFRTQKPLNPKYPEELLRAAINAGDDHAVMESLLTAMELEPTDGIPSEEKYFIPALKHLESKKDHRWINGSHFYGKPTSFFQNLSAANAEMILQNLLLIPRLDYRNETVLTWIADRFPALVWDYFAKRIQIDAGNEKPKDFQPVPYQIQELHKPLGKDAKLAIEKSLELYRADSSPMFRFRGGKLLAVAFPTGGKEFAAELERVITEGDEDSAKFVTRVMDNYKAQNFTHSILKAIIAKHPDNEDMHDRVMTALLQTGVVHGENGFVESLRDKKQILVGWQTDERKAVRDFAEKQSRKMDVSIADEQRRADEQRQMWEMQFDGEQPEEGEPEDVADDPAPGDAETDENKPEEPTKH
jgi:hypothetical protein